MKKIDTNELVNLIAKENDTVKIKAIASLISKVNKLEAEQQKLSSLQKSVEALQQEVEEEVKQFQTDKVETRGRKKKQQA